MSTFEHLAGLLLIAERASPRRAVTIDLFYRNESSLAVGPLSPAWGENAAPIGRIVAERGRVCWVIGKGNDLTLSDMLAADTGVPRATFERIYQSAKKEGIAFCEKLATSDIIDIGHVRRALRNQAAGALATLARMQSQDAVAHSIAPIPDVSYDRDFTFGTLEILQAAIQNSPELMQELGRLPPAYVRLAPKLHGAICFRESEGSEHPLVPVSAWCRRDIGIEEALELGLAAFSATQPADPVAAEIAPFALITHESECWLCAYRDSHLSVFLVGTRADYDKVLAALLEQP